MSDDANNSKNDDTSVSYYYDGTANVTDNSSTGTTASISNKTLSVEIKVLASATSNAEVKISPWKAKHTIVIEEPSTYVSVQISSKSITLTITGATETKTHSSTGTYYAKPTDTVKLTITATPRNVGYYSTPTVTITMTGSNTGSASSTKTIGDWGTCTVTAAKLDKTLSNLPSGGTTKVTFS